MSPRAGVGGSPPSPALLGKAARSAHCCGAGRVARLAPRICIEPSLPSTPYPTLRAAFPASRPSRRRAPATRSSSDSLRSVSDVRFSAKAVCGRKHDVTHGFSLLPTPFDCRSGSRLLDRGFLGCRVIGGPWKAWKRGIATLHTRRRFLAGALAPLALSKWASGAPRCSRPLPLKGPQTAISTVRRDDSAAGLFWARRQPHPIWQIGHRGHVLFGQRTVRRAERSSKYLAGVHRRRVIAAAVPAAALPAAAHPGLAQLGPASWAPQAAH